MSKLENVIYISGSGRSGSTLVERILHSSGTACSVGELHCLWRLPEEAIACSCGLGIAQDGFWREVLADAAFDDATLAELRELEKTVCRTGYIAQHGFSLNALRAEPAVQRFLDLQFRLAESIAAVGRRPVLVDSSKAGPRAWILACDPRVRFVHLYRDPADVIVSWRSIKFDPGLGTAMMRMPISGAAMDWWKVEYLVRRLSRATTVNWMDYRAFCADPRGTLDAVVSALHLPTPVEPRWTAFNVVEQGDDYHSLNGNPDRFDKTAIKIALREPSWKAISPGERPFIRLTGSALRILYPTRSKQNRHVMDAKTEPS